MKIAFTTLGCKLNFAETSTYRRLLVEAGAPLKGVAGRLGHKQIEITDSIYTHNTEKMQRDTADIFAKSMQTSS